MTTSEAFDAAERAAQALGLADSDGVPLLPQEAIGCVSQWAGMKWSRIEDELQAGVLTPDQYYALACEVIDAFRRERYRIRLESELVKLRADQKELGLVG